MKIRRERRKEAKKAWKQNKKKSKISFGDFWRKFNS